MKSIKERQEGYKSIFLKGELLKELEDVKFDIRVKNNTEALKYLIDLFKKTQKGL